MAAASELGLPAGPDVTSMQDVPELVQLWKLAIGAGFLEAADHGETFGTGAAAGRWHDGTDAEAQAIWSGALMFMVTYRLDIEAALDLRRGRKLDFYGTGMGVLALLFLARRAGLRVAVARLTPLGSWAVREQLAAAGV